MLHCVDTFALYRVGGLGACVTSCWMHLCVPSPGVATIVGGDVTGAVT